MSLRGVSFTIDKAILKPESAGKKHLSGESAVKLSSFDIYEKYILSQAAEIEV
jgi:hypothetical protein